MNTWFPIFHFWSRKFYSIHRDIALTKFAFTFFLVNFAQQCIHFNNMLLRIIWPNSMDILLKMPCFLYVLAFLEVKIVSPVTYYLGCFLMIYVYDFRIFDLSTYANAGRRTTAWCSTLWTSMGIRLTSLPSVSRHTRRIYTEEKALPR